jgi:hypothetical protein
MIYKNLVIDNFLEIQNELSTNLHRYLKNYKDCKSLFYGSNANIIKECCPGLSNFLYNKNLLNRFTGAGISVLNSNDMLYIHTDSLKKNRTYALNIPICNCENSYTIWYQEKDKNIKPKLDYYTSTNNQKIEFFEYDENNMIEIARLESSNPAFVNIKIPHRGISFNNNKRFLMSLRFNPELTWPEIISI